MTLNSLGNDDSMIHSNNLGFNTASSTISLVSKIPIALIIGICVCILSLLILLIVTIVYCIKKRKTNVIDKTLISNNKKKPSQQQHQQQNQDEKINKGPAHTNKSFNIDISSISAPMSNTVSMNGNHLTNLIHERGSINNSRSEFVHNPRQIMNNFNLNKENTEILVTEDEEQQLKLQQQNNEFIKRSSKLLYKQSSDKYLMEANSAQISLSTASTGVTNSSSGSPNNNNAPINNNFFSDFGSIDQSNDSNNKIFLENNCYHQHHQQQTSCGISSGGSSGSNSDPIAINNSLSSNSTADSPIYGYNVTSATNINFTNLNQQQQLYIQQQQQQQKPINCNVDSNGMIQIDDQNCYDSSFMNAKKNAQHYQQQQQHHFNMKQPINSHYNASGYFESTPESGYSTPSRQKKVVYEVIV
jgi:predicted RND superfamily exporter protein